MRPPAGVNLTALSTRFATASNKRSRSQYASCVTRGRDPRNRDVVVFRDRVVEIPDFAHVGRQRDFGKVGFARLFSISVIRSSAVMTVSD